MRKITAALPHTGQTALILQPVRKHYTHTSGLPVEKIKSALLHYCAQESYCCFFDSNGYSDAYSRYDCIAAAGAQEFPEEPVESDWQFGYISYDYKNRIEDLASHNRDKLFFEEKLFFVPELVFLLEKNKITVAYPGKYGEEEIRALVENMLRVNTNEQYAAVFAAKPLIDRHEYIQRVDALKHHIRRGDIYEINFCMEFFAENTDINPRAVYRKLNKLSHSPFSAFCRFGHHYLLSSSPERFLKREKNRLITQPIKGTAPRGATGAEDERLKNELASSIKERAENIMIVDLVRNDLSRIAKAGTVKVDELCGIYTFRQVHQMISTVSCELGEDKSFDDILRATFPMGSMTGAPKVSAMKLIEKYESARRGLYSGAIGYIGPGGDFDFSVVIRSILYNEKEKYLSFMAGSAVTAASDPEKEYEECLLKAKAMFEALR